jgi:ATP-dependent DNA ligase
MLSERSRPKAAFIEPCLPSPGKRPPAGPGWVHEIKHDGFRIMARRDAAGVRLLTRKGNDFSRRFQPSSATNAASPCSTCDPRKRLLCGREDRPCVDWSPRRAGAMCSVT